MANQPSHPVVDLQGPLLDELVTFASLVEDFRFALRALDELRSRLPLEAMGVPFDTVDTVAYALWNSLVATCGRCFDRGGATRPPGVCQNRRRCSFSRCTETSLSSDGSMLATSHAIHAVSTASWASSSNRSRSPRPRLTVHTVGFKVIIPGNPDFLGPHRDLLLKRIEEAQQRFNAASLEVNRLVCRDALCRGSAQAGGARAPDAIGMPSPRFRALRVVSRRRTLSPVNWCPSQTLPLEWYEGS